MINFEYAPWGMYVAAIMYVLGNGVWMNHAVRQRRWLGWLLWLLLAALILLVAGAMDMRMQGTQGGLMNHLLAHDPENHWIVLTLFALMSVPAAACVMLRQSLQWTRLAVIAPALLIFLSMGQQLGNPQNDYLLISIGVTLAVCASLWMWQQALDVEPEPLRKKHS